jgi:aspartate/methionine/tyrosine aminotransferase
VFQEFELELWQSAHEQDVRYELADSGVPAVSIDELAALGFDPGALMRLPLHYPEVNGTKALRGELAGLYGITAEEVLVTVGAAEGGGLVIDALTDPGDRVALMRPNYQQLTGLAANHGREVVQFDLEADEGWALSEQLERVCADGVRLIALSNPNNPTGHILSADERARIVSVARRHDAWLLSDEVYIGTEHEAGETASLLDEYEKTIVISSLSKAYGLSGLRLGWVAGPGDAVAACWRRHEYATISTSAPSMMIGEFALQPSNRAALFARNRGFIAAGHRAIREWAGELGDAVAVAPSAATPIAFLRLPSGTSSVGFARRLVADTSVLVAPGAYFGGFDQHVRITAARPLDDLRPALDLIARCLEDQTAQTRN